MPAVDVAVIGLGAMGSAALHHLASRGQRIVGIEQFAPGHDRGSSHGDTRIIRLGYFEHPSYVPLVRAAYPLWRALEQRSGESLLQITGIIELGVPDGALVAGTLRSARTHALPHEVLDAADVMRRFPALQVPSGFVGVFQPEGGILAAEPAIRVQIALAKAAGAEVRIRETVRALEPRSGGVRIITDTGLIEAGQAIVAAGPWVRKLLPDFPVPLRVTRQVLGWFEPTDAALFGRERCPVFMIENREGIFYGFPAGRKPGIKFAKHHHQEEAVDPAVPARPIGGADEALLRAALAAHLPAANGRLLDAQTCLYTMAPDGDFILDRLPGSPDIIVASPCSGHGFKFAPVIGEILADLVTTGATPRDISRFGLARFG
ncbi:MAG TPA: N-methyl-L-tryptophan oxidase [Xanthobacteraceae bacterium]|jgi:sarcosine oxidase|nr:N-methyl-L-tryptophan oxidase [Xanthobacteraceae bacterium]